MKTVQTDRFILSIRQDRGTVDVQVRQVLFGKEAKKEKLFEQVFRQYDNRKDTGAETTELSVWCRSVPFGDFANTELGTYGNAYLEFVKKHLPEVYEEILKEVADVKKVYLEEEKEGKFTFEGLSFYLFRLSHQLQKPLLKVERLGTVIPQEIRGSQIDFGMMIGYYISLRTSFKFVKNGWISEEQPNVKILEFEGYKSLEEVGITTLSDEEKTAFTKRGATVLAIAKTFKYCHIKGKMLVPGMFGPIPLNVNSRIVIDDLVCHQENKINSIHREYDEVINFIEDEDTVVEDRHLVCLSPFLPAFDLKNKMWGYVNTELVTEIEFKKDTIQNLIIDDTDKYLLTSIVEAENVESKDFIDGKGGGAIFLLHGDPGVGKTLTAESIAEAQQKPLYMVSVGELGTEISSLEESMKNILTVAQKWNAVLLIDEADIFLEARDVNNIQRNAMVGIFLRTLEYYIGTLFLTTNRANNLDPAFYSRISLALHYKPLTDEVRETIWTKQLGLYNVDSVNVKEITAFTKELALELNGRQIKNSTRIAITLAHKEKRQVELKDVKMILTKIRNFELSIKEK